MRILPIILLVILTSGCGDYDEGASKTDIVLCEIVNFGDGSDCVNTLTEINLEKTTKAWERKPFLKVRWTGGPDYIYYKECNAAYVREMKYGKYRDQDRSITGWKRWIDEKDARREVNIHDTVLHPDCDRTAECTRILNRL